MAPRTRSISTVEREPNPSRVEHVTPTTALPAEGSPTGTTTISDSDLAAMQATVERLTRYKQLHEQLATLRSEISGLIPTEPLPTRRRYRGDDSDDEREIKLKNIPTFSLGFNLQKRQEWLLDLAQQFDGAQKKYHDDRKKILGALCYMEPICRQRWYRHIEEKGSTHLRNMREDWPYFKDWTLTLIKNAASLESEVMGQLEKIHQLKDEDPREFHARLDALEQHFPRVAEKERALTFFAKLLYDLQDTIRLHIIKLPETREEMIDVAYHFWDIQRTEASRKRKRTERSPDPQRKKTNTQDIKKTDSQEPSQKPPGASRKNYKNPKGGYRKGRNNKDSPSKDGLNPIGEDGKRSQCFKCGSEEHYSRRCPKPPMDDEPAKAQGALQGNDSETE